jgi:hypothetical protein
LLAVDCRRTLDRASVRGLALFTAAHLVRYLELAGYVVMKELPRRAH